MSDDKNDLYLSTEFIFQLCIFAEKEASFPLGMICMSVLSAIYWDPEFITLTSVIFPPETIAFNLAVDLIPVPTPITSKSGGVVYSSPGLDTITLIILPLEITGVSDPPLPVKSDTFGCRS